jgi:hypothetical protein
VGAAADGGTECVDLPGPGQPCSANTCDSTAKCVTNMCIAKGPAGAVCATDTDCLNSNCLTDQKVCAVDCTDPLGKGLSVTGCPNGLRDLSLLLAVGLVLVPRMRKRRSSPGS